MARNPKIRISEKPWLHGASGWWCITIDCKRKKLDRDYTVACRNLKALRVQAKKGLIDNREWSDAPFSELADKYLDVIKDKKKSATYHNFRYAILRALTVLGPRIRTNQLTAGHLEDIECALIKGGEGLHKSGITLKDGRRGLKEGGYSPTTIKNTITTVQGVLNWAVRTGRIDSSPVPKYEKPAALIRNRVTSWEEFGSLLRHADRNFRRFLIALRLTGCRPAELSSLIWDWVDLDEGMWILPDHKAITRQRQPMPRMVRDYPAELIEAKLQVFDHLAGRRDARISKNPAGYLIQSIRKDYVPPADLQFRPLVSVAKSTASQKVETREYPKRNEKKNDVEQQRMQKHLAGLSAEERSELEVEALKSSPSLLVKRFKEAVASGSEMLVREYRRCLLSNAT